MVEEKALDSVFHALSDPTRRAILKSLSKGPTRVTDLAAPFAMSLAAASKHIKVLEQAGLVTRSVQGRVHTCALDARPMHAGLEWMRHYEKFWQERLDVLETLLRAEDGAKAGGGDAAAGGRKSTYGETTMGDYGLVTEAGTVRIERMLPGPIDRVWLFLTDPEKRRLWLASGAMNQQAGAAIELVFRNSDLTENDDAAPPKYEAIATEARLRGQILICRPPTTLAFTWGEDGTSDVRFDLTPKGDEVRLVVTHKGLGTRDALLSVAAGWHTHLDILVDRLAGRAPDGFWRTHTRLEADYAARIPAA